MNSATLRQLEYFVAASEEGTVSAAADRCHAAQASVSVALRELEVALGVQLLVRTRSKGVTLTAAGERTLPIARRMLHDAQTLTEEAIAERTEVAGRLRLASTIALSPRALPFIAHEVAVRYPRLDLHLTDGLSADVQRLLVERSVDCCLLYARQVSEPCDLVRLHELPPYAVLPADHRYADEESVTLEALRDERLILVQPSGSGDVIQLLLHDAGVVPTVGWSFANPETVRAMVARGLGYSVFSGRPKGTVTFDGRQVTYVPIADEITPNEVVLALRRGEERSARVEALIDLLGEPAARRAFG